MRSEVKSNMNTSKGNGSSEEKISWKKISLDSILRLNPVRLISNPVMFVVELSFFVVLIMAIDPSAFPNLAQVCFSLQGYRHSMMKGRPLLQVLSRYACPEV